MSKLQKNVPYVFSPSANPINEVIGMYDDGSPALGLSDLLERDLSSFEFYNSLSEDIKNLIGDADIRTFDELQEFAEKFKHEKAKIERGELIK